MSPTDLSTITFHQELDCQKCLLMSNRSLRSGKLALVPSVAFDKHMSRGLVLEHHDHHALQEWEGRLRRHLRGRKHFLNLKKNCKNWIEGFKFLSTWVFDSTLEVKGMHQHRKSSLEFQHAYNFHFRLQHIYPLELGSLCSLLNTKLVLASLQT